LRDLRTTYFVSLDVLLHVVPLDKPFLTVWALVRLLPVVYLPVPVEAAGVGQHLAAVLARHSLYTSSKVTSLGNFVGIVVNLSDVLVHVVSRDKAIGTEGAMVPPKPDMAQAEARLVPDGCVDVQHLAALLTLHALT